MVMLDIDPLTLKNLFGPATEEKKARALTEAGFDMGIDSKDLFSLQYQMLIILSE